MGAWGYGPMENDEALEWVANEVGVPLLAVIKRTVQAFLEQTEKDDVKAIEAEAAAALLVDLTGGHAKMKYATIHRGYLGREDGLWSLATKAIAKMLEDKDWLSGWNDPKQKRQALQHLLSDLKGLQEESEEG